MATSNSEVVYGNKFYTISSPVRNTLPNPVVSPPSGKRLFNNSLNFYYIGILFLL